jgi:hypothetical protein
MKVDDVVAGENPSCTPSSSYVDSGLLPKLGDASSLFTESLPIQPCGGGNHHVYSKTTSSLCADELIERTFRAAQAQ